MSMRRHVACFLVQPTFLDLKCTPCCARNFRWRANCVHGRVMRNEGRKRMGWVCDARGNSDDGEGSGAYESVVSRLSRRAITLLSSVGILENIYLGLQELRDPANTFCPTEACHTVLSSPYADVFGVPLSVFGLFAYCVCAYVNAYPALAPPESPSRRRRELETREPLLAVTTAMSVFSAYNLAVMLNVLHAVCQFCAVSTVLSFLLFVASVGLVSSEPSSRSADFQSAQPRTNPWRTACAAGLVTALVAAGVFVTTDPSDDSQISVVASAASSEMELESSRYANIPPEITTDSSEYAVRLATHLEAQHARMYGAYWCGHCFNQKQAFGKQAFAHIDYIECDSKGFNTQRPLCRQRKVPGYPTWEIGGEIYPGAYDLEDLAVLSEMDMEL